MTRTRSAAIVLLWLALTAAQAQAPDGTRDEAHAKEAMTPNQHWLAFLDSLDPQKGIYYLVSPEIIKKPPFEFDFDSKYEQLELRGGYVVIYGEKEEIASRIALAEQNMALITTALDASPTKLPATLLQPLGVINLGTAYQTANLACGLNIVGVPLNGVTGAVISNSGFSATSICVGFAITAGLAGYRIMLGENALELQRVIDVTQGAEIYRDRASGGRQ